MEKVTRGHFIWDTETCSFKEYEPKYQPMAADAPFVVTDEMAPTLSHADGKYYTSKSKLRREYKRLGVVETGGRPKWKPPTKLKSDINGIRDSVAKALNDARYGMAPLTEREKELCKQENRKFQEYKRMRDGK